MKLMAKEQLEHIHEELLHNLWFKNHSTMNGLDADFIKLVCERFGISIFKKCQCVYESECHGIEMIKAPSGKEWAIGGTNMQDRFKFCPYCGGKIA